MFVVWEFLALMPINWIHHTKSDTYLYIRNQRLKPVSSIIYNRLNLCVRVWNGKVYQSINVVIKLCGIEMYVVVIIMCWGQMMMSDKTNVIDKLWENIRIPIHLSSRYGLAHSDQPYFMTLLLLRALSYL